MEETQRTYSKLLYSFGKMLYNITAITNKWKSCLYQEVGTIIKLIKNKYFAEKKNLFKSILNGLKFFLNDLFK